MDYGFEIETSIALSPIQEVQTSVEDNTDVYELNESEDLPPIKKRRGDFYCAVCDAYFTEKRALDRHRKTLRHAKIAGRGPTAEAYPCAICGQQFTRDFDRRRHMKRRHAGIEMNICVLGNSDATSLQRISNIAEDILVPQDDISSMQSATTADSVPICRTSSSTDDSGSTLCTTDEEPEEDRERILEQVGVIESSCTSSTLQAAPNLSLPMRPKRSAILRNEKLKTFPSDSIQFCSMCEDAFEKNEVELTEHIRGHLDGFFAQNGEHFCELCGVAFVHIEDLEMHRKSAENGHCGFRFPHQKDCEGHHSSGDMADWDAYRYCVALRRWEQMQLHAFRSDVEKLTADQKSNGRWSLEYCRRWSRSTLASLPVSIDTFASAPCDQNANGERDVRGLQQRLRKLSINRTAMNLRARKFGRSVEGRKVLTKERPSIDDLLLQAISIRDEKLVGEYLDSGADPNFTSDDGVTTLQRLARKNDAQFARILLERGADPNPPVPGFDCLLNEMVTVGNSDMVDLLLTFGANARISGGVYGCPLGLAAFCHDTELVQVLIRHGARVNEQGGDYGNPLCAAIAGRIRTPQTSPRSSDDEWAYEDQPIQTCKLLIEHGADVSAAGPKGNAFDLLSSFSDHDNKRAFQARFCKLVTNYCSADREEVGILSQRSHHE